MEMNHSMNYFVFHFTARFNFHLFLFTLDKRGKKEQMISTGLHAQYIEQSQLLFLIKGTGLLFMKKKE